MLYSKHSSRNLAEVEQRLRDAAQRHKFGILHVHDLKDTLHQKGIELGPECRVYDVCNPQAASQALSEHMGVSAVLPCRISIFSEESGSTLVTVKPTDLLRATGLKGTEGLAAQVEREVLAIIDEAA